MWMTNSGIFINGWVLTYQRRAATTKIVVLIHEASRRLLKIQLLGLARLRILMFNEVDDRLWFSSDAENDGQVEDEVASADQTHQK